MKRLTIFFVLSLLLVASSTSSVLAQETTRDTETYILLFDESHNQYFDSELMSTALSALNTSFDNSEVNVQIDVIIQNDSFNKTNLQGVDLVMITNPGTDENGDVATVGSGETEALQNLVRIGGSVFYLSNPLSYNKNITGHGDPLNELLINGLTADVETATTGDTDTTRVIVDNLNYVQNNTFVKFDASHVNYETLVTEPHNITQENEASFLYYGNQISPSNNQPGDIEVTASNTAFVYDDQFEVTQFQQSPTIMYGNEIGDAGGRALLTGSSIMFSDYAFNNDSTWIEQYNNQELFENMIGWLLGITPLPEDQSIVEENFNPFFIRVNLQYAILFGVAFFVGLIIYYWRHGRLNPMNIMDVFTEKDSGSSSSNSKDKKSSKSKHSSKSKRRKRT